MSYRRRALAVVAMCLLSCLAVSCTRAQADAWCRKNREVCDRINGVTTTTSTAKPVTTTTVAPTTTTTTVPCCAGGGASVASPPVTTTTTAVQAVHVVALGDSQTADERPFRPAWPTLLGQMGAVVVDNEGLGGVRLASATMPVNAPSMQDRLATVLADDPDVLVLLGGTIDLSWGQVTVQQLKDAFTDIAARTQAAGVRFIVSTVPPFGRQVPQYVARNPERDELNTWIRATFPTVIDFDAHLSVGGMLPDSEQTSEQDGVHVGNAAEEWFAAQVWALVR